MTSCVHFLCSDHLDKPANNVFDKTLINLMQNIWGDTVEYVSIRKVNPERIDDGLDPG